jgi:hypothetical protein
VTVLAGAVAEEAQTRVREKARSAPRQYASKARRIRSPGRDRYQTAILAEFLLAAGVVAFLPLATGGPENNPSPSPYTVNDLTQLVAIAVVYFILALIPGKGSRWAAWLGLLVLLGIFYKKTATGELSAGLTGIHPGQGPTDQSL